MSRLVTVYYNDVFVSVIEDNEPYEVYSECPYVNPPIEYEVYPECPYVNLPIEDAERIAEEKINNGDWEAYLIPEFVKDINIIYHI